MPNRPTDLGDPAVTLQEAECGCAARIDPGGIVFAPCEDAGHRERLGLFWRVVAKHKGMPYTLAISEAESALHLPCGCRAALKDGTMHVFPCPEEGHQVDLVAISKVFCEREGKEFELNKGVMQ